MEHATTDAHHLFDIVANILLFFGISGLLVPLLQKIKISPIVGYLICGIAIGPYGLAMFNTDYPWLQYFTITDTGTMHVLGELGIIALMFMIGLELSLDRLKELKKYIFGLGGAQILVSAIAIFASLFDNSMQIAILLGASFALSSTAIVMKLLEEHRLSNRHIGILCFSVLLMQDMAVVPILVLATSFGADSDGNIWVTLASSLALGAVTMAAIYFLGRKVLAPLFQSVSGSKSPEWLAAFVVFIVVGCAAITYSAGLSLALGAFMAGLLIAETEFKHEIEVIIEPLKGLLLGIFFLSVGMMVNIAEILANPVLVGASVIGIYALKAAIILPLFIAFKIPARQSAEASVYLSQPGEFALLILGVAMASNLIPAADVQFFLLVTVVAMMFTPIMFKLGPAAGNLGHRLFGKDDAEEETTFSSSDQKGVVIAGYGRVGQLIGKVLEEQRIPYIAFDNNAARVQEFRKQGVKIIYGNAMKKEFWHRIISQNVDAAVIAIDNHTATKHILKSLRTQCPLMPVIVRSKDIEDLGTLYDEGANHVVAETLESSLRIAELLMNKLGSDPEETRKVLEKHEFKLCN